MANWQQYIPSVQQAEGGYQNNPKDVLGNTNSLGQLVGTNRGISAPTYEDWISRPPTKADMLAITKQEALQIFKKNFWDKLKADHINNQAVAETLVDHGINANPRIAAKMIQRIVGVKDDGRIGPISLAAINSFPPKDLFLAFNAARINYYENIKNYKPTLYYEFIYGWKKRVRDLYNKHIAYLNKITTYVANNPAKSGLGLVVIASIIFTILIAD